MLHIAMFQPDIPQNLGAVIRVCACMGVGLDIIEPCSFPYDERKIRQAALDYIGYVTCRRHISWDSFRATAKGRRTVLMTTKSDLPYTEFDFRADDILLAGSESAGVPQYVHGSVEAAVTIPMHGEARSMNIVNATSMILGEALRQTRGV